MSGARIAELAAARRRRRRAGADAHGVPQRSDHQRHRAGRRRGAAIYGGLLTPQGKILFDFIVFREGDAVPLRHRARAHRADFVKRLGFYRLRAKVEIADLSERCGIVSPPGAARRRRSIDGMVAADPRLAALGFRAVVPTGADVAPDYSLASEADYDAHRIALGVPEGGIDFAFGDAFPHDADMDQLGGVDFSKGCYVGQEVVSRMEHRGTARRRIVQRARRPRASRSPARRSSPAGKPIGTLGSCAGSEGARPRPARPRQRGAWTRARSFRPARRRSTLTIPAWARFGWPATAVRRGG